MADVGEAKETISDNLFDRIAIGFKDKVAPVA